MTNFLQCAEVFRFAKLLKRVSSRYRLALPRAFHVFSWRSQLESRFVHVCEIPHRVSSHVSFLFKAKSKSTSLWKPWKVDFWKEHVKCSFSKTCHDNERNVKPCLSIFFFFFVSIYQFKRILRTITIKNWLPALISANPWNSSQKVLHKTPGCSKINLLFMYSYINVFFKYAKVET